MCYSRIEIQEMKTNANIKPGVVVAHTSNPNIQEMEAGRAGGQGHPPPHTKFEASMGYMRPCLTKPKRQKEKKQS